MKKNSLIWKQINKFASEWKLGTVMVDDLQIVVDQLRVTFEYKYPDKDFYHEWLKAFLS